MAEEVKAVEVKAGSERSSGVQTLMRGLDILETVRAGTVTLNELSERLGLTRSTAHRLATALVDRRFLSFTPRGGYTLGPLILELGHYAQGQIELTQVARPILEDLAQETEDIVHLGVLEGDMVLYLEKIPGRRRILISSHVGERQPIACTGLGKAMVLEDGEERWRSLYGKCNCDTLPAQSEWLSQMHDYAAGGYAFDLEENVNWVRCVAAPIRDVTSRVVAAVSISSAAQYMNAERMRALIPVIIEAADAISRELGWRASQMEPPLSGRASL